MLTISPLPRAGPRISLPTSKGFSVTLYCPFGMGQATLVVAGCVSQWNSEVDDKYMVLMEEFWDTTLNSLSKQVKWPCSRKGIWCACQKEVLRALCVLNVLNEGSSRRRCVRPPPFHHLRHNMLHPWHFRPFLPGYDERFICIIPGLHSCIDFNKMADLYSI